jgi:hypothetical protein
MLSYISELVNIRDFACYSYALRFFLLYGVIVAAARYTVMPLRDTACVHEVL